MSDLKNYYRPVPVDFKLLALMPEEGVIGGVHWKGRKAKDLRQQILDTEGISGELLTASTVNARLRALKVAGFTRSFKATGDGVIWAKTEAGVQHLRLLDSHD